jgi:aminopeptidase
VKSGDLYYTLTAIPTVEDAKKDCMDYGSYVTLFFEMCDQPWENISAAQEALIKKFDAAHSIHITNDDGTDVVMMLDDTDGTPFTFCNSVIAKNVPGSEIFSAPRRDSVNGTIVAKGRFSPRHDPGKIIENLTLKFENGKIMSFTADLGAADFQAFLDRDPNNAYTGELGIGTNPHLGRHVINGLLVEKIGGSFHVALGDCYTYKTYEGKPVHLVNGNKSMTGDHWDMTTLLRGHGGNIELDGVRVMSNGKWLDPALAVLNDGWAAVPVAERPDYWKSFAGYEDAGKAQWNGNAPASVQRPSP